MGIIDRLFGMAAYDNAITAAYVGGAADPSTFPIASPWSTSDLNRIVADDVFGPNLPVNTREAAMRLPSVARARNLLVSTICRFPLVDQVRGVEAPQQPTWLYRTNAGTPQHRTAWTVDDLIFYGWSCWWRDNGSDTYPADGRRINQGDWTINGDLRVEVNGEVVRDDQVIVFPGLHEGVLSFGRDSLDDARALYRNVRNRLSMPTPGLELHQSGGRPLTDNEIDDLIDRWAIARRGDNGGVSYTSEHIEARPMDGDDGALMIEARNAAAVDIARLIGVSAGLIDATTPKASLNYETTTGRNQEFVDRDLALYMTPIEARLSADDVTPRGHAVAFDLGDFTGLTPGPTGPVLED